MFVDDSALSKLIDNKAKLTRKFGPDGAKKLIRCVVSMSSASSLAEYLPPKSGAYRCHQLKGNMSEQFAMDFTPSHRLVFEPIWNGTEDLSNGIDWHMVKRVRLLELVDYH